MKQAITRIGRNAFHIEGQGVVMAPTGVQFWTSVEAWVLDSRLFPDLDAGDRFFRVADYSSATMALQDAIGTMEYHLDEMYVGAKLGTTPRVDKRDQSLIRGVYVLEAGDYDYVSVYDPNKKQLIRWRSYDLKDRRELIKHATEVRLDLVEKYRHAHRFLSSDI